MDTSSSFGMKCSSLAGLLAITAPLTLSAAQIGGKVFIDGNRNALFNTGEPGLPSITIRLTWAGPDGDFGTNGNNQTFTQATDVNGNYNFTGLPAGNFRADLDDATLPVGLAVVAGGDPLTFNGVTGSQSITTAHFAVISDGLILTLWTVNEANPGTNLPRSGAGSPRLFCFTDYADQSGAHQFIDYGRRPRGRAADQWRRAGYCRHILRLRSGGQPPLPNQSSQRGHHCSHQHRAGYRHGHRHRDHRMG